MRNHSFRFVGLLIVALSVLIYIPITQVQAAPPGLSTPYSQNFDSLSNTGTGTANSWTNDATLAGWYAYFMTFESVIQNYNADDGSLPSGAIYSFGLTGSTERALGSVASGGTGDLGYGVSLINDTGITITGLNVSYRGEQWRAGNVNASHKLEFSYQLNQTNLLLGTWIDVDSLDFTGPTALGTGTALNGNTIGTNISGTVSVNIPAGESITLRWLDINNAGNAPDHGLAIDNLTVSAIGVNTATPTTIEPTATITPQNTSTPENTATSIATTAAATPTQQSTATHTATSDTSTSTATATTAVQNTSTPAPTNTTEPSCQAAPDRIYELQEGGGKHNNSTTASPSRTVVGVVTGDFQTGLSGFFMQDETGDGNPATSDGIFVYDPSPFLLDVVVGQRILVTGTTREFYGGSDQGQTQLDPTAIINCGTIAPVNATTVNLPIPNLNMWEQYEGMLIKVNGPLTVTETFTLARFGEVVVSAGGRLFQPTNYVEPGPQAQAEQQLNDRRRLLIDDGRNGTPADGQVPYIPTTESVFRQGFTTPNVTGVLGYGFDNYRLQPTTPIEWIPANPREPAPLTASRLRVAGFNLLNYFNTFTNCFGTQADNCRGADTVEEFNRQRQKTTMAIIGLDADVITVNELENDATDGSSAVETLIADLNEVTSTGAYAFINTGQIGTDAIRVGILYNTTTVTPVGTFVVLDNVDPFNRNTRPPLAQVFEEIGTGERFIVIANHFKSKGDCPSAGHPNFAGNNDSGDGQGCWNADRMKAATEILNWINTDPYFDADPDVLIMGDLNSYAQEDPIDTLKAGGFTNLIQQFVGAGNFAYSYTFQGQSGYLDHALANASFAAQIVDAAEWHINADEPIGRDYNDDVPTTNENPLEVRQPYLYQPNAYRSSDHDPVIVGVFAPNANTPEPSETPVVTSTPDETGTATATVETTATMDMTSTPDATVTAESTTAPTLAPTSTTAITPTATDSANSELVVNGGFETNGESNLLPWQLKKGSGDKVKCNNENKTFAYEGDCAFQFKGGAGENAKLQQDIVLTTLTFSNGDALNLSAHIRAPKSSVKGKVKLVVKYSDGTGKGKATIDFVPATSYTLFVDSYTVLSSSIEKIKVQIDHKSPNGKVLVDAVSVQLTAGDGETDLMPLP
jgi:uncharacterized protein